MKKWYSLFWVGFCLSLSHASMAQDDFDFSDFEAADDTEIKNFCNNKVVNLSPSQLVNVSFDYMGGYTIDSEAGDNFTEGQSYDQSSDVASNISWRLASNYPIISKSSIIVNAYLNYWESYYDFDAIGAQDGLATSLNDHALRTGALGTIIFKPLNEKNFFILQLEAAMNGNYNFNDISPELSKLKYSASLLYGWKFNDYTNFAIGVTRTYRGGRALHIPILMYNKTWNKKWGLEMLLPARAALRRNFSTKSILKFGYELEGASYHIQSPEEAALVSSDAELRKSEIRARLSWDKSLSDFIWFSVQAGAMVNYRFDLDLEASDNDAFITSTQDIPFYFRIGLSLVSP